MKKTTVMTDRKRPSFRGAVLSLHDYLLWAVVLLQTQVRLIFLPLHFLVDVLRFLDRLGQAIVRGALLLCSGALALALLAAVLFGLVRTLLHPWFA
jgi:hypothetical protein